MPDKRREVVAVLSSHNLDRDPQYLNVPYSAQDALTSLLPEALCKNHHSNNPDDRFFCSFRKLNIDILKIRCVSFYLEADSRE